MAVQLDVFYTTGHNHCIRDFTGRTYHEKTGTAELSSLVGLCEFAVGDGGKATHRLAKSTILTVR